MKRSLEIQFPPPKRACFNTSHTPPIPKCISTVFGEDYVRTLYEFWLEIQNQYKLSPPHSSIEKSLWDEMIPFLQKSLVIFPTSKELFGKPPRLPSKNISFTTEESTTEVIHRAIEYSLHQSNKSKRGRNIIAFGFQFENYRTSKKIKRTFLNS